MPKKTQDLHDFFLEELRDLYDAEKQLTRSLPKIAKAAGHEELRTAITEHLEVTKGHVQRLEQCFENLDQKAKSKPCKGIKGILEEGQEMLQEDMEDAVMDLAIAGGGRKIEHYEMVAYESLHAVAEQLGLQEVAELLNETLEEEREADQKLLEICQTIMQEAMTAGMEDMEEDEGEGGASSGGGSGGGGRGQTAAASKRASSVSRGRTVGAGASGGSRNGSGKSGGRSRGSGAQAKSASGGHAAQPLTDHEQIRQWAEDRGAKPACVRGTGKKGDVGMIRLDFPGYTGEQSLQPIDWDEWFEQFDENGLALIVQEKTADGERSNFNKLVSRETAKPQTRSAH